MTQDNVGIPAVDVTEAAAGRFIEASKQGVVAMADGRLVSPTAYLQTLMTQAPPDFSDTTRDLEATGMFFAGGGAASAVLVLTPLAPFVVAAWILSTLGGQAITHTRVCTLVIINGLQGKLTLLKDGIYMSHGIQTGYPVLSDGTPNPPTVRDEIPGVRSRGTKGKTHLVYGVGSYQFQKDLSSVIGIAGTGGAIAFTTDDPKAQGHTIAASWMVAESGAIGNGVTSDLFGKYGSLKAFYEATADKATQNHRSDFGTTTVWGTFGQRGFDSTHSDKANRDLGFTDLVLTVSVR